MPETLPDFASAFRQMAGSPGAGSLGEDDFNRLALGLFRLQHAANPDYRRLCNARGVDVEGVDRWCEIPAVPTLAFKQSAFSCLSVEQRTCMFESSGTTAPARSRHFHSNESLAVYEASMLAWFQPHLLPELSPGADPALAEVGRLARSRPRFLSLTPAPTSAPHSSLAHMLGCVSRQGWFGAARFTGEVAADGSWRVATRSACDFLCEAVRLDTPVVLAGTAFNFVQWLDALESGGGPLMLPRGSRVMETGGYKGRTRTLTKAELHGWLSRMLSVPRHSIVTEYGMTELSSQAYDRVAAVSAVGDRLRFPPWARAMVVSVETGNEAASGEVGVLRVFDVANVFSVLAIETEDLAVRDGEGVRLVGRSSAAEPRGCSLRSPPRAESTPSALAS